MFDCRTKEICISGVVLYALCLIAGFVFSQQAMAAASGSFDTLLEKARNSGDVRVIVTLNTSAMPDRASLAPLEFDRQLTSSVSAVQERVINALPMKSAITPPRRYPYTPQFAVTVTFEGLNSLINNPDVVSVDEDIPEPPTLDLSVPHIFPSHGTSSYSGIGWNVVILDTGVDKSHTFLTGKVVSEACYSTNDPLYTSTSVCPDGVTSSTDSGSGVPCLPSIAGCSHGTHVAGIAAGDGASFDGVARDANLIAMQVFSKFTSVAYCGNSAPCALTWRSDQISALNRVYALRTTYDIASINMSLGGGKFTTACDSDPRKPIIDLLRSEGIATVIASGNDSYTNAVGAPGCISTAVTVGATNNTQDTRAWFSNNSSQLDLYAPGVNINSALPGGGFASWNGTSMAAPHVAGGWAVMMQRFPSHTVDQIENLFKTTGVTVTSYSISRQRIDITEALGESVSSGSRLHTIEPCRLADTRVAGGKITAMETRSFLVWGSDSDIQSQGGTGDCGIPATVRSVVINVTSNQPESAGRFSVFPYNSPQPNASFINYATALTIANASTIPVCSPLCSFDLNVYSSSASHVIIDAVGWME